MTNREIKARINEYKQALKSNQITAKEFDGLVEALAKVIMGV